METCENGWRPVERRGELKKHAERARSLRKSEKEQKHSKTLRRMQSRRESRGSARRLMERHGYVLRLVET